MNDPLMQAAAGAGQYGVFRKVVESRLSTRDKVAHLFLAAVAREPNGRERKFVERMLAETPDDPVGTLEAVWWALLNSNEFILDH